MDIISEGGGDLKDEREAESFLDLTFSPIKLRGRKLFLFFIGLALRFV